MLFRLVNFILVFGFSFNVLAAKPSDPKPIVMTETTQIAFGLLSPENGICTMGSGGTLTGSAGQSCSGVGTPGEIDISGQNNLVVGISFTNGTQPGITFRPQVDGPSSILVKGKTSFFVIGEMEFSGATEGSFGITYGITANYE